MKVAGLQRVTLIDFPGKVAASIFLAGCNLACGYCHNHWMIDAAGVTEAISVTDLLAWLETRRGLLDGVCISGGEPTLDPELPDLIRAIRAMGYLIKLDTNGTFPRRLEALLGQRLVDYVAMDVKAPLDDRYASMAGVAISPEPVRQSMAALAAWGGAYELRTTVGPGLDEAALLDMATELADAPRWILQVFEASDGVLASVRQATHLTAEDLTALLPRLQAIAPRTELRD